MEGSFVYWDDPRRSTSSGRRSPAPRPSIPSHRKLRRNIPIAGYPGARGGCAARPSRRDRSGSAPRSVQFRTEIGPVPHRDRSGSTPRSVRTGAPRTALPSRHSPSHDTSRAAVNSLGVRDLLARTSRIALGSGLPASEPRCTSAWTGGPSAHSCVDPDDPVRRPPARGGVARAHET